LLLSLFHFLHLFLSFFLSLLGWAMEARVYAEDPYRNFLPSIGMIEKYVEPAHFNIDNSVPVSE
jgi:acetyl/propionyl-CoA carboxylase alpha subunit